MKNSLYFIKHKLMRLTIMRELYSRRNLRSTLRGKSAGITLSETAESLASKMFPGLADYQLTKEELAEIDTKIDSLNAAAVKEAKDKADFIKEAKTYPLLLTDECPQCYSKEMNIYKISDSGYFCHCQYCDVSASTRDYKQFLESLGEAIWKQS